MAHSFSSTLFRQRLDSVLDRLAARAKRRVVAVLPQTVQDYRRKNECKLGLCHCDLTEEEQAELLVVLNNDWDVVCDSDGSLTHWCAPGCCSDERTTKVRVRQVLATSMGRLFACPLLYRWKHMEPALAYCLRNLCIHGLLLSVYAACMSQNNDDQLLQDQILDLDHPDLSPALKHQVRMGKVLRLLSQPDIIETDFDSEKAL